jgi:hypothetical protein
MKYALVAAALAAICFAIFGGSARRPNSAEAHAILTH